MTEEERRFKIEKLEKYSEERRESKDHIENMFLIGTLSLAAIVEGIDPTAHFVPDEKSVDDVPPAT